MVAHGFHTPEELATVRGASGVIPTPRSAIAPTVESPWAEAMAEIAKLKERVAALEARG